MVGGQCFIVSGRWSVVPALTPASGGRVWVRRERGRRWLEVVALLALGKGGLNMLWVAAGKHFDAHVAGAAGALAQAGFLAQVAAGAERALGRITRRGPELGRRRQPPKLALPAELVTDHAPFGEHPRVQANKAFRRARQRASRMTSGQGVHGGVSKA